MGLNFIANQPVLFERKYPPQPCINNDNRAYAQLVERDDTTCFQVQLTPCGNQKLCDPKMFTLGSNIIEKNTANYTEPVGTAWSFSSGDILYNGVAGNHTLRSSYTGLNIGSAFRLKISVPVVTQTLTVLFGNQPRTITEAGDYVFYFIATDANMDLDFKASGFGLISILFAAPAVYELRQMTNDCWEALTSFATTAWSYEDLGGIGQFCSNILGGTLVNTNAYTSDNVYHRVTVTISNCTTGTINVNLGGVDLGNLPAIPNGTYEVYGIPTDLSGDLIFSKVNSFDGCISGVSVHEMTVPTLSLIDNDIVVGIPKDPDSIYEDRATWCIDWRNNYFEYTLKCDYYQLSLNYICGEADVDYTSLTTFAFAEEHPCTFVLSAHNDGDAFGFIFDDAGGVTIFTITMRLRMLSFNPIYPAVGEEYLTSGGQTLRTYTQSAKVKDVLFDRVDENTHDCIRLILLSDTVTLSDAMNTWNVLFPVQNYEPEWAERGKYNLAQSRATIIFDNEPSRFNRNC